MSEDGWDCPGGEGEEKVFKEGKAPQLKRPGRNLSMVLHSKCRI